MRVSSSSLQCEMFAKLVPILLYLTVLMFYHWCRHVLKDSAVGMRVSPNLNEEIKQTAGLDYYYFTVWTFVLQIVFVATAILDELSNLLSLPRSLRSRLGATRAFVFHSLLFPTTLLVMTFFWSLWHVDRSLIFPKALDQFFPTWLNHALHTFIAVPLVIELSLPKKGDFKELSRAAVVLVAYMTVYTTLFLSIYFRYGIWLYPIYKLLTWPQRAVFCVAKFVAVLVFQRMGVILKNSNRVITDHTQKVQ